MACVPYYYYYAPSPFARIFLYDKECIYELTLTMYLCTHNVVAVHCSHYRREKLGPVGRTQEVRSHCRQDSGVKFGT